MWSVKFCVFHTAQLQNVINNNLKLILLRLCTQFHVAGICILLLEIGTKIRHWVELMYSWLVATQQYWFTFYCWSAS
jgi:hypothetical protein